MHEKKRLSVCFFFKAEDGIRDHCVTGVQTCALPISCRRTACRRKEAHTRRERVHAGVATSYGPGGGTATESRGRCPGLAGKRKKLPIKGARRGHRRVRIVYIRRPVVRHGSGYGYADA